MGKIWANSGDSHLVEPEDLFRTSLPPDLAARMPRSVKHDDGRTETLHVDGKAFERRIPMVEAMVDENGKNVFERAPGANDPVLRLKDLDDEGVWAEVVYPSIGIWTSSIEDPALLAAGARALNDWSISYQESSPRYVCTATIPLLDPADAAAEIHRSSEMGFTAGFFSVVPAGGDDWNYPSWEPVWRALSDTGMVLAFHIGTEPFAGDSFAGMYFRGPGGAILNYMETTYGGQRAVAKMIASGVFDRYPGIKVLVSEGGATWGPFVADRLDEAYRQHGVMVRPKLSRLPSSYLYENIYASFQHDRSAVAAATVMGWPNVMWGSDYPHLEGTFGHSQKVLHELLDHVPAAAARRITVGAFEELFPHVPPAPTNEA